MSRVEIEERGKSLPPQLSGGGGFDFEDRVAAFYLSALLAGARPFLPYISHRITGMAWQVEERGWKLNDLLLSFEGEGPIGRMALSVKRRRQVTSSGFPSSFQRAVWAHWLGKETEVFDRERDFLGLAVGQLSGAVEEAWDKLLEEAIHGEPRDIAERFSRPRPGVNPISHNLFSSLQCPAGFNSMGANDPAEIVLLVRRLRLLPFDFRSAVSTRTREGVELCRKSLESESFEEAHDLWEHMLRISSERRFRGGSLVRHMLLNLLGNRYDLADLPDHRKDWQRLENLSRATSDYVKETLGAAFALPRTKRIQEAKEKLAPKRPLLLVGEAGSGKSALAKSCCRDWTEGHLLWLSGEALNVAHLAGLEQQLQLRHPLGDLLQESSGRRSLLVLDGIEGWAHQARQSAVRILRLCAPLEKWAVLVTTRPSFQRHAIQELLSQAGLEDFEIYEVPPLSDTELQEVSRVLDWLRPLFLRPDLAPLLRTLKVLDWLVTALPAANLQEAEQWARTSDVIDTLWTRWTGTGSARALSEGLLIKLGFHEAENMRPSAGLSLFSSDELGMLDSLERHELVRVQERRISFQHDLAGDWARLQWLVEREADGTLPCDLPAMARFPRWHPAIRLYGERLLERRGVETWWMLHEAINSAQDSAGTAKDLLLDSVFTAVSAREYLEQLWARLATGGGTLLKHLLERFRFGATIPHPKIADLVANTAEAQAARAFVRLPYWPLWPAVLEILWRHEDEVAILVPHLAADLCRIWLSSVPRGSIGRSEAAHVAVRIAREIQLTNAAKYWREDNEPDGPVYESLLWAAFDLPDEVSNLTLELARRREEPPEVQERRHRARSENLEEELVPHRPWHPAPMLRPPFPDGPRGYIEEEFRKTVLETQALLGLIVSRPDVAREVLLASCLEEPDRETYGHTFGPFGSCGTHHIYGMPAVYFRGPFLPFLKHAPEQGLDAILRLVNHASAIWAERIEDHPPMVLWGDFSEWKGAADVYAWYRGHNVDASTVTSALVALEKWLYELVETKQDPEPVVRRVFAGSRSVAFAGALVALGKKAPALFAGCLQPLLFFWPFYEWDRAAVQHEQYRFDSIDLVALGEKLFNKAQSWHTLPHRKSDLLAIAVDLFRNDANVARAFQGAREVWRCHLDAREVWALPNLLAIFDVANYKVREREDGLTELVDFEWPSQILEQREKELSVRQSEMRAARLAEVCQELNEHRIYLSRDQADEIWQEILALESLADCGGRQHSLAAGIAVLLELGREWLEEEPRRRSFCRDKVSELLTPVLDDSSPFPGTGLSFSIAKISVLLLAGDPDGLWVRHLVAKAVVNLNEGITRTALKTGFKERQQLQDDWRRMQNLALLWSALSWVGRFFAGAPVDNILRRWQARLMLSFVHRRLRPSVLNWERLSQITLRLRQRLHEKEARENTGEFISQQFEPVFPGEPGFNLGLLRASFDWLPDLREARGVEEREEWLQTYRNLVSVVTRSRQQLEASDIESPHLERWLEALLSEHESWLFPRIARLMLELSDAEERRSFWQPILEGGRYPFGHSPEDFLRAWFSEGKRAAESPEAFIAPWAEMISYVLYSEEQATGQRSRFRFDIDRLMGLGWLSEVLGVEYQSALKKLLPLYERWADLSLGSPQSARDFARFIARPAARDYLCPGVLWLRKALPVLQERTSSTTKEEGFENALVNALRECWGSFCDQVRVDQGLKYAFLDILNWLAHRGSAGALDLQQSVRETM